MKYILIFFLFYNNLVFSLDLENSESRWEQFWKTFYSKPNNLTNQNFISSYIGQTFINFNNNQSTKFTKIYNLEFWYGFIRINDEKRVGKFYHHQGEYVFLSNISNNFKTFEFNSTGINTDSWRFGFGINDGYIFEINNNKVYLSHSGAFTWIRNDFYNYSGDSLDIIFIKRFDEKMKFGMSSNIGVDFELSKNFNLNLKQELVNYYPNFDFLPWFLSYFTDLLFQRFPDIIEKELIDLFDEYYPIYKIIYKSLYSLIISEIRKSNCYFPINSEKSLQFNNLKIGISIIF